MTSETKDLSDRLTFTPLDELTKPRNGFEAVVDHYWIVDPARGAAFASRTKKFPLLSPQCNRDRNLTERLNSELYGNAGFEVQQIPVAYIHRGDDD